MAEAPNVIIVVGRIEILAVEIYAILPNPCPNHILVFALELYLTYLKDDHGCYDYGRNELEIMELHHKLKKIIIKHHGNNDDFFQLMM